MAQIQLRRGTVAAWAAANPILADGEPGFALPDGPLKVGNGIDPWLSLPVSEGGLTKAEADNTYAPIGAVGGIPETNATDVAFAVVDSDDKASWIAATATGGIPAHTKALIADVAAAQLTPPQSVAQGFAVVDEAGHMSDLAVDAAGRFMPHSAASMSQKQGIYKGPTASPAVGSGEYIHFKTDGSGNLLDILAGSA